MTRRSLTTILLLILSFAVFSNNALANGMDSMGTHAMLAFDMPNHAQQDCCKELNHQQECGCYVAGVVNLGHQISYSHEVLEYLDDIVILDEAIEQSDRFMREVD